MKLNAINDLLRNAGLSPINTESLDVDATASIEHNFFENSLKLDYRQDSVNFMIKNKIDFHSTCNNVFNITRKFIKIACPTCKNEMSYEDGGGNSDTNTSNYRCDKCKTTASITMPNEGIHFSFKENRKA